MLQDNKACLNSTGYEFIRINSPKNTAMEIKNFLKDNIKVCESEFSAMITYK